MQIQDQMPFIEAALRERLHAIAPDAQTGDMTPLADMAATLLARDAVEAGADLARAAALGKAELSRAMDTMRDLLEGDLNREITLPFGTRAVSRDRGSVTMAGTTYVLVLGRPGIVREEEVSTDLGGVALEMFVAMLDEAVGRLACRALGRPTEVRVPGEEEIVLRFPPCEAAGGLSLDVPIGVRALALRTVDGLVELAIEVVRDMRGFWGKRAAARKIAEATRAGVEAALGAVPAGSPPIEPGCMSIRVLGPKCDWLSGTYIEFAMLDHALRPGVDRQYVTRPEETEEWIARMVELNVSRAEERAELAERGAVGEILDVAAAIVEAAPEGVAAVLDRLCRDTATEVVLPVGPRRVAIARLEWRHGLIGAKIFETDGLYCSGGRFHVTDADFPMDTLASAPGRAVDTVVDLPIRCACPVLHAETGARDEVVFTVREGTRLVKRLGPSAWSMSEPSR